MKRGLQANLTYKFHAPTSTSIPALATRQTPIYVWLAVFQLPWRAHKCIGVAGGPGGPDFWYSSMRDRPVRLLRSTDTSHCLDFRRTDLVGTA